MSADELADRLADLPAAESLVDPRLEVSVGRWRLRTATVLRSFFALADVGDPNPPAGEARGSSTSATSEPGRNSADEQDFIRFDCDRVSTGHGGRWCLTSVVRRATVEHLDGDPARLLATLDGAPTDPNDVGRVMAEAYLRHRAPALDQQDSRELAGTMLAVDWLQGVERNAVRGLPDADAVQAAVRLSALLEPLRAVADGPMVGRDDELAALSEYVYRAAPATEVLEPLVIQARGGMGKSTLVAHFLLEHSTREPMRLPFAYLTFDRPELLPQRPLGILVEVLRQLGQQFPDDSRLTSSAVDSIERTQQLALSRSIRPDPIRTGSGGENQRYERDGDMATYEFAKAAGSLAPGPIVCVLDTFERAQRQGVTAVDRLWQVLERAASALPSLRVVILGRAEIQGHPIETLELKGLPAPIALSFLADRLSDLALDHDFLNAVAERVHRNPLTMRLSADLMRAEERGLRTAEGRRRFLMSLTDVEQQGVLYRRVLDHIDDRDVRALAVPGLAVRRITPEVIAQVLAPSCGLGSISAAESHRLFAQIRVETSLVSDEGGAVVHRADVRREVLPILYRDDPELVNSLHRRAVEFYSARTTTADRTEELYHRLALDQETEELDRHWDDAAGAALDTAIDEFPARKRSYLANRLGIEADAATLREADDADWAAQAVRAARGLLDAGRPGEALQHLRERTLATVDFEVAALLGEALARTGQLEQGAAYADAVRLQAAERGLPAEFVRFTLLAAQMAEDSAALDVAGVLLRQARDQARVNGDLLNEVSAGVSALRVDRRSGNQDTPSSQALRADVVASARTLTRRQRRASPSLVRDIAAEVGSLLPDFVIEATELVGVDIVSPAAQRDLSSDGWQSSLDVGQEILVANAPAPVDVDAAEDPLAADEAEMFTSDQQGKIIGDHLRSTSDERTVGAISDYFKHESDRSTFS